MANEAEAGDIGTGRGLEIPGQLSRTFIERGEGVDHQPMLRSGKQIDLVGRRHGSRSQSFGQHEHFACLASAIGQNIFFRHYPDDREPVFGFLVFDAVTTRNIDTGLNGLFVAPCQNFPDDPRIQAGRDGKQIQRADGLSAHGVDIRKRIGRCDLAKFVGIIHNRREKIHGMDDTEIRRELVNRRIVRGIKTNQQVFVGDFTDSRKNIVQDTRSQFCPSATGLGHLR